MTTKIYNSDLTKEIIEVTRLQGSMDSVPTEINDKIQLVAEVSPKLNRLTQVHKYGESGSQGAVTIFTTPTDRDFYITSCELSLIKDATSDMTSGSMYIQVTINGESIRIINFQTLSLTASNQVINGNFTNPIKVDRNTVILMPATGATAGNTRRAGLVHGFYVNNINA